MKLRSIILLTILAILLSACSLSLAEDITPPPDYKTPTPAPTVGPIFPANPPDLASGAAIYAEKCSPCHGATGLADGAMAAQLPKPAPAFGKPEVARAGVPAKWFTTVTQGKIDALMPPFNSLSEQERWNVVAYAMSLGTSVAEVEQGKTVYLANCAQCHGVDGQTVAKSDFTDQAMMSKLTQKDIVQFTSQGVGDMPGLGTTLSQADMFAAAAYVRTFTFAALQATEPATTPQPVSGTPAASPTDSAAATPSATTASVSGIVTNGSTGTVPAGLKAVLHIFTHDTATQQFSEAETKETPVSADGAYSFADLSLPEGYAFYVAVDYAGTTYESDAASVQAGQPLTFDLPLTIYDTTIETSALVIDQAHILFDYSKPDIVQVIEFYIISNPGKKAVVAAEKGGPVVKISLPKGYSNLQLDQGTLGDRFIQTADGFADTLAVPPADPASQTNYSLVFAFDLPAPKNSSLFGLFGSPKLEMAQILPLNASAVSILVPEGAKAEGENFTDGGLQSMGDNKKFQLYTAGSRKAGESLTVTVSGAPSQTKSTDANPVTGSNSTKNIVIGVGVFGVALILVGAWLYWRDRRVADEDEDLDEDESDDDEEGDASDDTEEVMDAIIALDDQYKSGNITEDAYKERRAELKDRLKRNI